MWVVPFDRMKNVENTFRLEHQDIKLKGRESICISDVCLYVEMM